MLGALIKEYREKNNYSQREFAGVIGVSTRSISRWEQEQAKPSIDELKKLSETLGISETELLRRDDSTPALPRNELERITDGVENLVAGQDSINQSIDSGREEFRKRQEELIQELRSQNADLMNKINENTNTNDLQKEILRQKRIKNLILFGFVIALIIIIIAVVWYVFNFGPITSEQPVVYEGKMEVVS